MRDVMMISDLARATGLSIDTLNFYLRVGLLEETGRFSRNGYRYFDEIALDRLRKIVRWRSEGQSIKEIRWKLER